MFGDYVGRQIGDVERLLEEKGYKPPQIYEVFSDEPAGVIIKQTQPDPGDEVVPEETTVIFEVSKGKEPIELDNLTGLTREEARGYLEAKGLIMEPHEEYSDTVPEGQVIRQDPRAKTELNQGDKVNVYFSIGPEILPPRSYSVTLPIEYTLEEEENNEPIQQVITIYIQDMNNPDITVANEEMSITEDTEINIDLMIEQKSQARYRVMRDNEVIYDETISYEEGE